LFCCRAAVAWPVVARAQLPERTRRIGVLIVTSEDDPQSRARVAALQEGLASLGWAAGRNLQIDYRFGISDADRRRRIAAFGPTNSNRQFAAGGASGASCD
jgi:putative ABC transport system substrate-binding protein